MGIKNLWQLLSPVGRSVSIETLAGKTLAVDVSIWLTQFIKAMRDDDGKVMKNAHIIGTLRRVVKLVFHRIRPIFVFDGGAPALKSRTLAARRKLRSDGTDSSMRKTAQRILASQLKKHKAAIAAKKRASSQAEVVAFDPVYQSSEGGIRPAAAAAPADGQEEETGEAADAVTANGMGADRAQGTRRKKGSGGGVGAGAGAGVSATAEEERGGGEDGEGSDGDEVEDDDDDVDWEEQDMGTGDGEGVLGAAGQVVVDSDGDEVWQAPGAPAARTGAGATGSGSGARVSQSGAGGDLEEAAWAVETDDDDSDRSVGWEEVELPERNEDIDPEVIASLPDHVKKQVIEAAKRRQRMRSRAQYMPVAGNPAMYSQTQLSNFLRSKQLNSQILKAHKQEDSDRAGKRIASEAGRRYIMTAAGTSGSASSGNQASGASGGAGGGRNGSSAAGGNLRRRRIADEGEDFKEWSYVSGAKGGDGTAGSKFKPPDRETNGGSGDGAPVTTAGAKAGKREGTSRGDRASNNNSPSGSEGEDGDSGGGGGYLSPSDEDEADGSSSPEVTAEGKNSEPADEAVARMFQEQEDRRAALVLQGEADPSAVTAVDLAGRSDGEVGRAGGGGGSVAADDGVDPLGLLSKSRRKPPASLLAGAEKKTSVNDGGAGDKREVHGGVPATPRTVSQVGTGSGDDDEIELEIDLKDLEASGSRPALMALLSSGVAGAGPEGAGVVSGEVENECSIERRFKDVLLALDLLSPGTGTRCCSADVSAQGATTNVTNQEALQRSVDMASRMAGWAGRVVERVLKEHRQATFSSSHRTARTRSSGSAGNGSWTSHAGSTRSGLPMRTGPAASGVGSYAASQAASEERRRLERKSATAGGDSDGQEAGSASGDPKSEKPVSDPRPESPMAVSPAPMIKASRRSADREGFLESDGGITAGSAGSAVIAEVDPHGGETKVSASATATEPQSSTHERKEGVDEMTGVTLPSAAAARESGASERGQQARAVVAGDSSATVAQGSDHGPGGSEKGGDSAAGLGATAETSKVIPPLAESVSAKANDSPRDESGRAPDLPLAESVTVYQAAPVGDAAAASPAQDADARDESSGKNKTAAGAAWNVGLGSTTEGRAGASQAPQGQGEEPQGGREGVGGALISSSSYLGEMDEEELAEESERLQREGNRAKRDAETVTEEMKDEVMELLKLFGVPYVVAPMEAEAQCCELEQLRLVDGTVTDDSDAFAFGGRAVYKNIFNERKYVEAYLLPDAEKDLGVGTDEVIALALLLGSDYTEGVKGVGIVNAMEVINAFPLEGKGPHHGLSKFRKWIDGFDPLLDQELEGLMKHGSKKDIDGLSLEMKFHLKHRTARNRWTVPDGFPSKEVINAYTNPQVDKSEEPFSWATPDVDGLRALCQRVLGWDKAQSDGLLMPMVKELDRAGFSQPRIDRYFMTYHDNKRVAAIKSKRLRTAVEDLAQGPTGVVTVEDSETAGEEDAAKKSQKKKRTSKTGEDNDLPEDDKEQHDATTTAVVASGKKKRRRKAPDGIGDGDPETEARNDRSAMPSPPTSKRGSSVINKRTRPGAAGTRRKGAAAAVELAPGAKIAAEETSGGGRRSARGKRAASARSEAAPTLAPGSAADSADGQVGVSTRPTRRRAKQGEAEVVEAEPAGPLEGERRNPKRRAATGRRSAGASGHVDGGRDRSGAGGHGEFEDDSDVEGEEHVDDNDDDGDYLGSDSDDVGGTSSGDEGDEGGGVGPTLTGARRKEKGGRRK
ncbi:unnamed protein product [Scytosiphon promiscuus]